MITWSGEGTCMLSRCSAIGANRARLEASRISPSSLTRSASSACRRRSSSRSARACSMPYVLRAMTPVATRTKPNSASATTERRDSRPRFTIRAFGGRLGVARCALVIAGQLVWRWCGCLACHELAQRKTATRAHGLPRRTHAVAAPLAERVLHDAILARVISDNRHHSAREQTVAQQRKRALEPSELIVDGDPKRL